LSPAIALITNLDREHMESYGSWENLQQAFVEFANKVPFYGAVVACADDQSVRELIPRLTRRVITYGLEGSGATVIGEDMQLEAFGSACDVAMQQPDSTVATLGRLRLRVPGRHNLLNAIGAVAVGLEAGVAFERIAAALEEFRGADRRFQMRGEESGVMVVDDYGHHPTEIAAVIAAARAGIDRRVVVVFQPHRYSRTNQLLPEFGTALAAADEVVLTDIYAAGEDPIPGVTIDSVAEAVRAVGRCPVRVVKSLQQLPSAVASFARSGDLVITLGAGSIGAVGDRILDELRGGTTGEATPDGSRRSHSHTKNSEGEDGWG
jgi:UDP-N-acetylmuramate--alanine ligase